MPNYAPYIPKTFIEYYENMKNWLIAQSSKLSNFEIGSRIRTLLEGLSLELANSDINVLNGFKNISLDNFYTAFGFARKLGNKGTGFIRIEHTGHATPMVYPVFTIDLFGVQFTTILPVTIPVGSTFVMAEVIAVETGVDGNILALSIDTDQGKGTILDNTIVYDRIYNQAAFTGGTNEESDADRLTRWQAYIKSFRKSTPEACLAAALGVNGVVEASVINNINPYTNTPETGWVSLYVTDGTSNPPQALIDEVYKVVAGDALDPVNYPGIAAAGVKVFVQGITNIMIDIVYDLTLKNSSLLTDAEAKTIAETAAYNYVNNLPIGEDMLLETLQSYILAADPSFYTCAIISPVALVSISIALNRRAKINTIAPSVYPFVRIIPL